MKRYHSYPGTGSGDDMTIEAAKAQNCDFGWDPSTKVMREHNSGTWVKFDEIITSQDIKQEFDRGYKVGCIQGRKEGQVKVDAMQAAVAGYVDPDKHIAGLETEYQRGLEHGKQVIAVWPQYTNGVKQDPTDTRTNQLLNELYHDRSRLERVVKDAVALMTGIDQYLQEDFETGSEGRWVDQDSMRSYLTGCIDQFVDTHGDQE